VIQYF